ncbi:hypothetical protein [Streptomyces albidochromogenes]|uniref:Lipoprotein n=1 Tax=Streptomyces albidochromogenes TaxID=329524 RepID=A0ABW6FT79_9ACTN
MCTAAVLVAVAAVPGCTSPAGGPAPARTAQTGLRELTHAEQITVERGEELLVKKCMEKSGFKYWAGPIASVADRQGNGYVLTDIGWAKRYGYGSELDRRAEKARLGDRNAAYTRSLPKPDLVRYNTTLDGSPSHGVLSVDLPAGGTVQTTRDGCRAEAMEQLYGDFPAWFRAKKTAQSLTALYAPDILRNKRFKDAVGAWATCMDKAGHPYADPPEIRAKLHRLTRGLSPSRARDAEVELAVAEATCATTTPLVRTARSLERAERDKVLRRYREEMSAFQRMSLTALGRARTVTGDTP